MRALLSSGTLEVERGMGVAIRPDLSEADARASWRGLLSKLQSWAQQDAKGVSLSSSASPAKKVAPPMAKASTGRTLRPLLNAQSERPSSQSPKQAPVSSLGRYKARLPFKSSLTSSSKLPSSQTSALSGQTSKRLIVTTPSEEQRRDPATAEDRRTAKLREDHQLQDCKATKEEQKTPEDPAQVALVSRLIAEAKLVNEVSIPEVEEKLERGKQRGISAAPQKVPLATEANRRRSIIKDMQMCKRLRSPRAHSKIASSRNKHLTRVALCVASGWPSPTRICPSIVHRLHAASTGVLQLKGLPPKQRAF